MVASEGFQSRIEIHLRMRPVNGVAVADYGLDHEEGTVEWVIPRQAAAGMHNHQREKYSFSFTGILGTESKQDEVFDSVAKKVGYIQPILLFWTCSSKFYQIFWYLLG